MQLCVWAAVFTTFSMPCFPVRRRVLIWESRRSLFSLRLWTSVGHLSDVELMHRLGTHTRTHTHTHTHTHTLSLSVSLPSWLAWIFSFDPTAPLLLCCRLIIYQHSVTGQTPIRTESDRKVWVKISFFFHNCMKRNCKTGLFIYYWCLLTSHALCRGPSLWQPCIKYHVLRVGGGLHAFTATASW